MVIDLTQDAVIQALQQQCAQMAEQIRELQDCQTEWVNTEEAVRITGLSRVSLWRKRQQLDCLIRWKSDSGVRYERASLHEHNRSRAVVRGLPPTP